LQGLYFDEEHGLHIPAENIEATIINGAKAFKKGSDIKKFTWIENSYIPLNIYEKFDIKKMSCDMNFYDVRQMVIQRSRITRTRPRFNR
jgi:hypothetical protein